MSGRRPTWELVLSAARELGVSGRRFTREALVRGVQQTDPSRAGGSIGPVIQGMTKNASGGPPSPCGTPLIRVGRGVYQLDAAWLPTTAGSDEPFAPIAAAPRRRSAASPRPTGHVVLVGCAKTKLDHAAKGRDLYVSRLFKGRRRYAEDSGKPWFILSSRWGLVDPDEEVATYDLYLGDLSRPHRAAWGAFVVEQLATAIGPLNGLTVELHAGSHYREALEPSLRARGALPVNPVPPGGVGETTAWYSTKAKTNETLTVWGEQIDDEDEDGYDDSGTRAALPPAPDPQLVPRLLSDLTDPSRRVTPSALLAAGPADLASPGLYSWWVDLEGAADLSGGAGTQIDAGLIYAGLAGATRWPSGKRSTNTLWSRLAGMHLGGRADFSTFRRTLAALLREPLAMGSEDDPRLTAWMEQHLEVTPVVVDDPDALGLLEGVVLAALDPPLNLRGMPRTELRTRISQLRANRH